MSEFANSISEQIVALEQEAESHKRDSRFYARMESGRVVEVLNAVRARLPNFKG